MKNSKFTGSAWGLFGWNILLVLSAYLLLIPLAFVLPKYLKWYYSHIEIDGEQLVFEYEGPWWGILGWILFIIITLGLGSYYAMKKIIKFEYEHVHTENDMSSVSNFDGSAWGLFGWSILSVFAVYLLVFPIAFVIAPINKWYRKHTVISGRQLVFEYEGPWWGILGWLLFTIITLGLGSYYAQKKQIQWGIKNTHFQK